MRTTASSPRQRRAVRLPPPAGHPAVLVTLAALTCAIAPPVTAQGTVTRVKVVSGVMANGRATDQWLEMVRRRLPSDRYDSVARIRRPLNAREKAWADLIEARQAAWASMTPSLASLIAPIPPPDQVVIVLGNRGAEDAFTHDPRTIGFDLAALRANYGRAEDAGNTERLDRFFRHEFVHLLQKAWLAAHPWPGDSPLRAGLLDIWAEGIGNYYSLAPRWLTEAGRRSAPAARALAELEPRFVARLAALACASPEAAAPLLADLSSGKFDQKWGALPAALWLEAETGTDTSAIRRFLAGGPEEVWELAGRHLPGPLKPVLREARGAASACAAR